ncbi:unnamed protein product [Knipowitschia caucasica]
MNRNQPLHVWPLRCLCTVGCWFRACPVLEGGVSSSRSWLRSFLLLKLVTLLLFPHWTLLGLVLGCPFSLKALVLLRSPRVSTKPSTVFLYHLALTDALLILHWTHVFGLRITLYLGLDSNDCVLIQDLHISWLKEVWIIVSNHLLDTHLLASLCFLGFLGLEATLVSRWPLQTRAVRTSQWAQLGCTLVWVLVLLEVLFVMFAKIPRPQSEPSFFTIETLSFCLRRVLWLCDVWLHYNIMNYRPQKRRSSFH